MKQSIGIVVADDHPLLRDGVIRTLQNQEGIDVLGAADSAKSAVEQVIKCRPDIVLLDISMPGNGIMAAQEIAELPSPPKIIMLTVSEDDDDIIKALEAGALGYVLKGVNAEELTKIVREVHIGLSYISPSLAVQVLIAMNKPKQKHQTADELLETLTARETEILKLVSVGKSNKEVGLSLNIQEKTVKHYMTSILQKLHAKNRVEAAIKAQNAWQ
jgi:DNA-binding NarL/FixJ family response regulator